MTYTFATLDVSESTYNEIRAKLVDAGYEHAILADGDDELIDMKGIALAKPSEPEQEP